MLRPSRKMCHALEAVLDIACGNGSDPVRSSEITRRQGIPKRYIEQVMQRLVRAGVLTGVRGPRGGYRLAGERRRVTVGAIARVVYELDEDDGADRGRGGDGGEGGGSELAREVIQPLWRDIESDVMARLDAITIDDLCGRAVSRGGADQRRDAAN